MSMAIQIQHEHEGLQVDARFTSIEHDTPPDCRDIYTMSCQCNARDTSTSPRDVLEELRQNHTSILNITSDGEESDDDDLSQSSFLFAHLNEPPRLDEDFASSRQNSKLLVASCAAEHTNSNIIVDWLDTSTDNIRNVTESFTESFCPGAMAEEHPCRSFERYTSPSKGDRSLQHQMEKDIFALLGCTVNTTDEELDAWTTPIFCPMYDRRLPVEVVRSRMQRIHRYRKTQLCKNTHPLKKHNSFDVSVLSETNTSTETSFHDAFGSFWGLDDEILVGTEPPTIHESEQFDGYDSDPGDVGFRRKAVSSRIETLQDFLDVSTISNEVELGIDASDLIDAVQESLNITWKLTWHATSENMKTLGKTETKKGCYEPSSVQLWFERGQILHRGKTIIEPHFMWRQHNELVMPHQMRLLSICRVLPVEEMDRALFPLARTSLSFIVRTLSGEDFLFEAMSESERDSIVQRWKLVVARLATLAVFQDVTAMQNEFFSDQSIHNS